MGDASAPSTGRRTPLGPVEGWPQSLRSGPEHLPELQLPHRPVLGRRPRPALQRRLEPDPRREAPLGAGPTGPRGVVGDLGHHRPPVRAGHDDGRGDPEPGPTPADAPPRLHRGVLLRLHLQPRSGARAAASRACSTPSSRRPTGSSASAACGRCGSWRPGRRARPRSAEDACRAAAQILAGNPHDLPFALLYLLDDDGRRATLAGQAGAGPGHAGQPRRRRSGRPGRPVAVPPGGRDGQGASRSTTCPAGSGRCPAGRGPSRRGGPSSCRWRSRARRDSPGSSWRGSAPGWPSTTTTGASWTCWPATSPPPSPTPGPTRRSGGGPRRWPSSTGPRPPSSRNVSHEFRTPLTLMLGPVEDLLARSRRRAAARAPRSQLEVVNRNGLRLLRLVNTLLDFSRIEAGRVRAAYEPTDLAALTADLASVFRSAVRAGRAAAGGRLPAAGRAGLRGPGDVGEGRPQPALQRLQVHLRGRDRRHAAAGRAMPPSCGSGTPARASPPRRCPGSSSGSTGSRTHGAGPTRGAGSGWRWCRSWSSCTAASVAAESVVGAGHDLHRRRPAGLGPPAGRPDRRRAARRPRRRRAPAPSSRRRCAGSPTRAGGHASRPGLPASDETPPAPDRRPAGERRPAPRPAGRRQRRHAAVRRPPAGRAATEVEAVPDGEAALAAARERPPGPGPDRRDDAPARRLRPAAGAPGRPPRPRGLPVILLSARAGEESRVEGHGGRGRRLPRQAVRRPGAAGPRLGPPADGPDAAGGRRVAPARARSGSGHWLTRQLGRGVPA